MKRDRTEVSAGEEESMQDESNGDKRIKRREEKKKPKELVAVMISVTFTAA